VFLVDEFLTISPDAKTLPSCRWKRIRILESFTAAGKKFGPIGRK